MIFCLVLTALAVFEGCNPVEETGSSLDYRSSFSPSPVISPARVLDADFIWKLPDFPDKGKLESFRFVGKYNGSVKDTFIAFGGMSESNVTFMLLSCSDYVFSMYFDPDVPDPADETHRNETDGFLELIASLKMKVQSDPTLIIDGICLVHSVLALQGLFLFTAPFVISKFTFIRSPQ